MAVAGRGLNDRGLLDAGLIHGGNQLFQCDRPRARPVGLMAAERRQRIARGVAGNDVRVNVDGDHGSEPPSVEQPIVTVKRHSL